MRVALVTMFVSLAACTPLHGGTKPDAGDDGERSRRSSVSTGRCVDDRDCVVRDACLTAACEDGMCVEYAESEGTVLADDEQVTGDCKVLTCDRRGRAKDLPDDEDKPPSDGNPCHEVTCDDGQLKVSNVADSTSCNGTGTCNAGACSVCVEGMDCTRPEDCTISRRRCDATGLSCHDTGVARPNQRCDSGKVCQDGSCVPCLVGNECERDELCQAGRIVSCDGGVHCESQPLTGPSCGVDSTGHTLYCSAGECKLPCREGACASAADPCTESRWDCTASSEPTCVPAPREDGTECGENARCNAGTCVSGVLINGSFNDGLHGWTVSGDADTFLIGATNGPDAVRSTLSTSPDGRGSGGATQGAVSQAFSVPNDALAVRFVVSGGRAHVRLKDDQGNVLEECVGRDSYEQSIPVSWDLTGLRGQTVVISIEDDVTSGDWAYVTTTGFDIIREVDGPLRNPQFLQGLDGWETTADGRGFVVVESYNFYVGLDANTGGVMMYGRRRTLSTFTRDTSAENYGGASQGTASQMFTVPDDAVALRFDVHGGRSNVAIKLTYQDEVLFTAAGTDSDGYHAPVSWPLQAHRGKLVRLVIEDSSTAISFGHIGTSGFDIITSYNGP